MRQLNSVLLEGVVDKILSTGDGFYLNNDQAGSVPIILNGKLRITGEDRGKTVRVVGRLTGSRKITAEHVELMRAQAAPIPTSTEGGMKPW